MGSKGEKVSLTQVQQLKAKRAKEYVRYEPESGPNPAIKQIFERPNYQQYMALHGATTGP